jgi:hypothetical protein
MTDILATNTLAIAARHIAKLGLGTWESEGSLVIIIPNNMMATVRVWTEDIEAHLAVAPADDFGYRTTTAKLEAHGADRAFIEGIIDLAVAQAKGL